MDLGATGYDFGMLGQTSMSFGMDQLWSEEDYFQYRSDVIH